MSVVERIDAATLGWVKAELDQSISEIRSALDDVAVPNQDRVALRSGAAQTNQVEGTLHMVELYGAAMLAGEIKVTLEHMISNAVDWQELSSAVHEGLTALSTHLDDLSLGGVDLPLKLLPATNALRVARDAEIIEPLELFSPDLSTQPPPRQDRVTLTDTEFRERAVKVHRHYQRTLLEFLNNGQDLVCLDQLAELMDSLIDITRFGVVSQLWWVARAYLRGMGEGSVEITKARCILLAKVDRELKRTGDHGEVALVKKRPSVLVKQMLFELGQSAVEHAESREVKTAFQLGLFFDDQPSAIENGPATLHKLAQFGEAAGTTLDDARDTMALFFESDTRSGETLEQLQKQLSKLAAIATEHESDVAIDVLTELHSITGKFASGELNATDRTALTLTNALRSIESLSREQPLPNSNWRQDIEDTVIALRTLTSDDAAGDVVPFGRPQGRELRQLIGTVSPKLREALQSIEKVIETYARKPANVSVLEPVTEDLHAATTLLDELGQGRAGELMDLITLAVRGLRAGRLEPLPRLMETLAFGVGAVQSHVQSLDGDSPRVGGIVDRAVDELDEILGDERTSTINSRSLADSLKSNFDAWLEQPHDSPTFRALRQDLRAAQAMGGQYGEERIGQLSFEMMSILDIIVDSPQSFSEEVSETLTASNAALLLRLRDLPDDVLDDVPVPLSADDEVDIEEAEAVVDDEIFQIFVEESEQALELIQVRAEKWQADMKIDETLVEIRRGFHTLKGSGRLVGIEAIGDLAWILEELLNDVINAEVRPVASIVPLISDAREALAHAMEQPDPTQVQIDVAPWQKRADAIREGSEQDSQQESVLRNFAAQAGDHLDRLQRAASVSIECQPGGPEWVTLQQSVNHLTSNTLSLKVNSLAQLLGGIELTMAEVERDAQAGERDAPNAGFADAERQLLMNAHGQIKLAMDSIAQTGSVELASDLRDNLKQLQGDFELERDARVATRLSSRVPMQSAPDSAGGDTITSDSADESSVQSVSSTSIDDADDIAVELTTDSLATSTDLEGDQAHDEIDSGLLSQEVIGLPAGEDVDDTGTISIDNDDVIDMSAVSNLSVADLPSLSLDEPEFERPASAFDSDGALDLNLETLDTLDTNDAVPVDEAAPMVSTDLSDEATAQAGLVSERTMDTQASESPFEESHVGADSLTEDALHESEGDILLVDAQPAEDASVDEEPGLVVGDVAVSQAGEQDLDTKFLQADPGNAPNSSDEIDITDDSAIDDDFREIFCDEAVGALERMRESFAHFSAGVGGTDEINRYQRELHTIKGSARTIGYGGIADLVHAVESTIEAKSDALIASDEDTLSLFEEFQDSLQMTISRLQQSPVISDLSSLTQRFELATFNSNLTPEEIGSDTGAILPAVDSAAVVVEDASASDANDIPAVHEVEYKEEHDEPVVLDEHLVEHPHTDDTLLSSELLLADDSIDGNDIDVDELPEHDDDHADEAVVAAAVHDQGEPEDVTAQTTTDAVDEKPSEAHVVVEEILVDEVQQEDSIEEKSDDIVVESTPARADDTHSDGNDNAERAPDTPSGDVPMVAALATAAVAAGAAVASTSTQSNRTGDETNTARAAKAPPPRGEQGADDAAAVRVPTSHIDSLISQAGELNIVRSRIQQSAANTSEQLAEMRGSLSQFREQLRELEIHTESQMQSQQPAVEEAAADGGETEKFDPLEFDRFTKLQTLSRALTERLNDLELIHSTLETSNARATQVLNQHFHVTNQLQDGLLRTRMVSVASIEVRLRHLVRQIARELGKRCRFSLNGGDVEIDRNVIQRIAASLEHMIRNALDHGIERPEERAQANKPAEGHIALNCRQEGNQIVFQLADDGRGIDADAVIKRARKQGLEIDEAAVKGEDLLNLISSAGFTTRSSVTQVSGRGVGMDVVHDAVRQLDGSLEMHSEAGKGTRFNLRVPTRLAVTYAYMVTLGERQYAIGDHHVRQLVTAAEADFKQTLNREAGTFTIDGDDIPLFALHDMLDVEMAPAIDEHSAVLISRIGERDFAVVVDSVSDKEEIAIRPLGRQLANVTGIQSATITPDGDVALILDIKTLWQTQQAHSRDGVVVAKRQAKKKKAAGRPGGELLVMVVDDSLTVRKITEKNLARKGIATALARDGVDALEMLRSGTEPSVMLVDIEMPRMDGFELTRNVRADEALAHIPIVIITSRAGDRHREHAFEAGASDYLSKPYDTLDLIGRVRKLSGIEADEAAS